MIEQLYSLNYLHGLRLSGSPEFAEAAGWVVGRLKEYGLTNAHTEKWGPFGRAWSEEHAMLEMLSPSYSCLTATSLAWSAPSNGLQTAEVLYAAV